MKRYWIFVAIAVVGCSRQEPQPALAISGEAPVPVPTPAPIRPMIPEDKPPEPYVGPFMKPDKPVDLRLHSLKSGTPPNRYWSKSYVPIPTGPGAPPTGLPDIPIRTPAKILGDQRFFVASTYSTGIALSPDGKLLAIDNRVYDTNSGAVHSWYPGDGYAISRIQFSPDGTKLYLNHGAIGARSWTLKVRDVPGKQQILMIQILDWCLSRDGRLLMTLEYVPYNAFPDRKPGEFIPLVLTQYLGIRIYDTSTWKGVEAYRVWGGGASTVAFSPDDRQLLIGCSDGSIHVWDRKDQRETKIIGDLVDKTPTTSFHIPYLGKIAFSPDGKTLAAASSNHTVQDRLKIAWWNWPEAKLQKSFSSKINTTDLRFSPDGQYLFAGADRGDALVLDLKKGQNSCDKSYGRYVPTLGFASNDRAFAPINGFGRPLKVKFPSLEHCEWPEPSFGVRPPAPDFPTVEPMPPEKPLPDQHEGVALPGGGRFRKVYGKPCFEHVDAGGSVIRLYEDGRSGAFEVSPDGKTLLTLTDQLRVWNLTNGKELATLNIHPRPNWLLKFSPDGRQFVASHNDGLLRVWDVATLKPVLALANDDGYFFDRMTFSKDGRWLVAGGDKYPNVIIWDTADPGK